MDDKSDIVQQYNTEFGYLLLDKITYCEFGNPTSICDCIPCTKMRKVASELSSIYYTNTKNILLHKEESIEKYRGEPNALPNS